jgi:hypothetical protein
MSGGAVRVPEGCAAVFVPDPARLALLDDDDLLDAMAAYEKATAGAAAMSAQAAGLLAGRRRELAVDEVGPDASKTVRDRALGEAEAAVVDEIRLATGLGLYDALGRVRLGAGSPTRAAGMRDALTAGACTWAMARAWSDRTATLAPELAAEIGAAALAPTRDGAALSYRTFRCRLDRLVAEHVPAKEQRDYDLSRRDAYATLTPHGTGEYLISGSAERVTAAALRIDAIARAARRRGDGRTLGQLRSDVSLDLILYGDIPGLVTPVPANTVFGRTEHTPPAPAAPAATPTTDVGVDRPGAAARAAATSSGASGDATRGATSAQRGGAAGADTGSVATGATTAADNRAGGTQDVETAFDVASTTTASGQAGGFGASTGAGGSAAASGTAATASASNGADATGASDAEAGPEVSGASGTDDTSDTRQDLQEIAASWLAYLPGGLPPAELRIVISAAALLGLSEEPGTLADGEPLAAHIVRDLAYAAGSTWRRLVTDPVTGEAIELTSTSYTPPARLREAIHARDGTCRAPGSTLPAERCDLDHDLPWDQGGATSAANLSAKSRRPHGHKTRGQWSTTRSPDGTIVWTTGTGRQYSTYPYQYDPTAPGRTSHEPSAPGDTGMPIVSAQAKQAPPDRGGPGQDASEEGRGAPIDYRAKGFTPTTRPALHAAPANGGRKRHVGNNSVAQPPRTQP